MKLIRLSYSVTVPLSIFFATLAIVHGHSNRRPSKYCNDKTCIIADDILLCQNQSVDPCNDFYEHACGRCNRFYYEELQQKIKDQVFGLFNNTQTDDLEVLKKSKKFYDACMDWDPIASPSVTFMESILTDNVEWPVTVPSDKWNNRNLTWQVIHESFVNRVGVSALFDVSVVINHVMNSSVHEMWLFIPLVSSPITDNAIEYKEYLVDAVGKMKTLRGFNVTDDDLLDDCLEIIALKDKLKEIRNMNVHSGREMTIETLQNDWDAVVPRNSTYSINWLETIKDRFNGTGIVIDASEKIHLCPGSFVANLARVLVNTPVRTIVNYIHWVAFCKLVSRTNGAIWPSHVPHRFSSDSSMHCIMNHKMGLTLDYMYAKRYFSIELRTAALEIIQQIRDEMKRDISDSSWLDDTTKSLARRTVDAMTINIGYPEWYDKPGKIDDYYRELTVGSNYFDNVRAYSAFVAKKRLSKLRSPVDESETISYVMPTRISPSYDARTNSLNFPAASFQTTSFVFNRPSVLNYGAFGAIVGHEIAHGFDIRALYYDKDGNKRKGWTQSTMDTYKTKVQCFVEQYNKYTLNDTNNKIFNISGTHTQRENIADTVGCRLGLKAYRRAKNDGKTNNVKLGRLRKFTDEQLYFYERAYMLCAPESTQAAEAYASNSYSPNRLRLIGTVSNMQEFADAFHCKPGSPMNPTKKCLIWD